MMRSRTAIAAAALLMLGTGSAHATDELIPGRRLSISDRASRQRLAFVAKSPVIVAPTPQGSDDPTSVGATLRIVNPDSGESASLDLPPSRWTRNTTGTLYKFKNASAPAPPSEVKIALLGSGRLKVSARATGITLNETSQSAIGIVLTTGSLRYCALFGGQILQNAPGRFSASNAPAPTSCPQTRYDLANGCHGLKSVPRNAYAVRGGNGGYTASSPDTAGATPFFMKPTALGKYLFYAEDRSLLSVSGNALTGFTVGSGTALADTADWTVDRNPDGDFIVSSETAGQALAVDGTGKLMLANAATAGAAAKFAFDPATGCAEFPELKADAVGETFKGRGVDQPVLGFADVHVHVSATTFLGGAHYGAPFHRFGVTQAVGNCESAHGPNGRKDVVGSFLANDPAGGHDTQGWPTFVDWPARDSLTHEATYYKWLERAWKAGLRIMVNDLVENEALCQLQRENSGDPTHNCNEMDNAELEAHFMRNMVDYIDAQEGGPGKGWFRIVTSPGEARQVINDGKLAVVLGIETSHLFNCKLTYLQGGLETYGCDQAEIDAQLERFYNLGVRQMFPIHEFDNAFGGNGIFDGFVLNLGNRADTGKFWQTYDCPNGGLGADYFYDAGAIMTSVIPPGGGNNPFVDLLIAASGGNLPAYPPDRRQCNARWLTDIGRYALQKLMQKKIIIDADHMELMIKSQLLDMAEAQAPVYPVVSTHGGHGGISMDQARRIMADGGIIYDYKGNGRDFSDRLNKLLPLKSPNYFFGMGYGADTNGLGKQAAPRGAGATPVQYPFTLFQGAGWGPQFAGIAPVTFNESTVQESGRSFDINAEGMAHYGLVADFVEEVRIEGGEPALTALYNSAEAYLQMWERTLNR